MGIKVQQLKYKEYDEHKNCIAFTFDLKVDDNNPIVFRYTKRAARNPWNIEETPTWLIEAVIDRDGSIPYVFRTMYQLPKQNVPLEMVCAFGLVQFQMWCKQNVQYYSNVDFDIGNLVGDMYG